MALVDELLTADDVAHMTEPDFWEAWDHLGRFFHLRQQARTNSKKAKAAQIGRMVTVLNAEVERRRGRRYSRRPA